MKYTYEHMRCNEHLLIMESHQEILVLTPVFVYYYAGTIAIGWKKDLKGQLHQTMS